VNGITLRYRDNTTDRLGVMAQKAEKMLMKIMNEWLCNVQLFPKVWILETSIKEFRISGSVSGSRLKAVIGLQTHYPAGYPTGKPGSDHLWLDWIRTIANFVEFGLDPGYKPLQNLGSGPDLDWVNGKEMGHFCFENAAFFKFYWTLFGLGL